MRFAFPPEQPGGRRNTLLWMGTLIGKTLWFPQKAVGITRRFPFSTSSGVRITLQVACGITLQVLPPIPSLVFRRHRHFSVDGEDHPP
jgi:hypothetical protein